MVSLTSLFDYALIVTDKIILKSDTLIDGYDSSVGYDPLNPSPYLRIGTTSTLPNRIVLNNNVVVKGDVLIGIGGKLDEVIKEPSGGATTGPRYNLPHPFEFEVIDIPACGPSLGSIDTNSITVGVFGATTYATYDGITLSESGLMDIEGNVVLHILGDIRLNHAAEIRVTPSSSLTIYLDGHLRAGQSNGINNMTYIPANFMLFGTGPPVQGWEIMNAGDFYGVYYAPNADIDIYAKGDIFGSVSGLSFELKQGGDLHYDIALSQLDPYKTGFGVARWWEE
jgi:hypothetical protein